MTEIAEANFNVICRLCTASVVNEALEIFDDGEYTGQILKKIKVCLQLKVEKNDRLPKSICKRCAVKLDEYYSYRESCLQTELILLRCLANASSLSSSSSQFTPVRIKDEISDEKLDDGKKSIVENNLSDLDMSPGDNADNNMTDEDDDDEIDEEKAENSVVDTSRNGDQEVTTESERFLPELGEPCPEDYVLMKEETFNIDPVKDSNSANRGATSSILADYLIEFSNSKGAENETRDKDIVEGQKLRREILPPMWDVYEKSVTEKQDISTDGIHEKERTVTVTHRRYIINKGAFPCSLCGECFEFDQGRKRDDLSEDKAKLYDCQTCGKVFPRRSSWKRHQNTHEDIKPFVCRLCNKGFNRKEHLSRHLLSHGTVRPFACTVCGKQFLRKEHLLRHQLLNPPCASVPENIIRPFCCDVCSQGFVRKEHLQRHRKRAHDLDPPEGETEPKPFTCQICTKTFTRREHLKRHQLIHQRELTMNCLNNLTSQLNSKQEFPFRSELSVFPATTILPEITLSELPVSLENQIQYEPDLPLVNHTLEIMEDSHVSNVGYNNAEQMMEQDGQHEDEMEVEELMEDDNDEPLPPIPVLEMSASDEVVCPPAIDISKSNTFCNVCFKNFSRRSHLLRHMKRIHSMQLPPAPRRKQVKPGDENGNSLNDSDIVQKFNCQQCGKIFSRRSHLDRHEKVHQTGKEEVQPYECVTCGETFLQSKLLDKHMEVHGNTVPENFIWM